ncbi:uncharacterized protein PHALS_07284 [Plasmopara halstedii]|uniref:RxLR-like protein n=1 Tax=Plasmopara halstedii TaxID=4781 RepID=A0A0P1B6W4_PLAHL|nr:uncharacterized protein PHALS_07284 [Plasmopara halstedii]CEG49526.1 hypothetical protein PHALS_07284 [Plasmopara halstedii]|eukprot:XP_024585895.1 hypothetical protein PHALS_07284 [Plasmopara halstedii]
MRSALTLLLVSSLALTNAADTSSDVTPPALTLSPEANLLLQSRDETTTSLPSDNHNSAMETHLATTAPPTEPSASIPTDMKSTVNTPSNEQSKPNLPSNAANTNNSNLTLDRDTSDSPDQIEAGSLATASSKSSTASVDTLNDKNDDLSTGNKSSASIVLPTIFGGMACVGAIVLAIMYKKKHNINGGDLGSNATGTIITPSNQAEGRGPKDYSSEAMKMSDLCHVDVRPPSTNISDSLSPFSSARCKVRVSSPVSSYHVSSESNTEFSDVYPRHIEGSNVVLTFGEVSNTQSSWPQVQL